MILSFFRDRQQPLCRAALRRHRNDRAGFHNRFGRENNTVARRKAFGIVTTPPPGNRRACPQISENAQFTAEGENYVFPYRLTALHPALPGRKSVTCSGRRACGLTRCTSAFPTPDADVSTWRECGKETHGSMSGRSLLPTAAAQIQAETRGNHMVVARATSCGCSAILRAKPCRTAHFHVEGKLASAAACVPRTVRSRRSSDAGGKPVWVKKNARRLDVAPLPEVCDSIR